MDKENIGRIPRELLHEQHERLSNKHIQTLSFLQELANENKVLKERVKLLEESLGECKDLHVFAKNSNAEIQNIKEAYVARANEIKKMSDRHRLELMQMEETKSELERELKEQILKMHQEIEALKEANADLRETAAEEKNNDRNQNVQILQKENEDLSGELESVRSDLKIFQSKKASEMSKLQDLKEENKLLKENLQENQQKANELEFRLDKALGELSEKSKNEEAATLLENLKYQIKELKLEREDRIKFVEQMKLDFRDLQDIKTEIMQANLHLQSELENLLGEYGQLSLEYDKLRKHSKMVQDNKTFKDFVLLKRELVSLKDENEVLKLKTRPNDFLLLKEEFLPQPPLKPQKKNSLDVTRSGAKRLLSITSGQSAS
ncbi:unnamed protein product [Lymnaea stagnalis]|uniref:Uncharacterized protein n=1 Tax=Lymnaea stagnalis TaxID=6523 RepID=A0AAV2HMJ3_LYMST